jgi:diguanylate cyclase (GGDEF)-like protein
VSALPRPDLAAGNWEPAQLSRSPAPVTTLAATEGGRAWLLLRDLADTIASEVVLLYRPDRRGRPQLVCTYGTADSCGVAAPRRIGVPRRGGRRDERGLVSRALTYERAIVEPLDPNLDSELMATSTRARLTQALAAPVRGPGDVWGALVAGFASPPRARARTLWIAEAYAAMTAVVVQHPSALLGMIDAPRTDHLTGCITYDGILHELSREIERADRGGLRLSCCLIDLDRFKGVNDRFGHAYGNAVLRQAARALREGVRSGDTVGRYGGDQFVAILPEATERDARWPCERLRAQIASEQIAALEEPLTASVGIAEWMPGTSTAELLAVADHALLTAKGMGGDVVVDSHQARKGDQR